MGKMNKLASVILGIGLLFAVVVKSAYISNSGDLENETCAGSRFNKIMLNQSGYVQYVTMDTVVPELTAFHSCFWFNFLNPLRKATIISYAVQDAVRTNKLLLEWTGGDQPTWNIVIGEVVVASMSTSSVTRNTWHQACLSWNGVTGEYVGFQDGTLIGNDINTESKGLVIRADGGVIAVGQNQNSIPQMGMDLGAGTEGWLTLVHLDTRPIVDPNSRETRQLIQYLYSDCTGRDKGNLISWLRTPRKGYGGVTEVFAREQCRRF